MSKRRNLSPLSDALAELTGAIEPQTMLARVQSAWPKAAGTTLAGWATPVSERAGKVTFACSDSMVAHELEMLKGELLEKLNSELAGAPLSGLKFVIR